MRNATLKGLLAHKLRLAATALGIVLGVSFVAGTYVLTDTINATFEQLFKQVTKGVDVAVRTKTTFSSQGQDVRDPMPASLLGQVKRVDGVKVAEGSVNGYAQFVGTNGKAVTTGCAPTLGVSADARTQIQGATTVRSGRLSSGPGEVVVDARTASKQGFKVGDSVKVLFQGPARTFTVVGVIGFGQADNLAGATLAGFDTATAQDVLNREGRFDEIDVVALLVGAFLIFNTFTIIVAQRTRELALLRCLGASRRQVLGSVLLESFIVAVVASLVGLSAGLLIAQGLRALLGGLLGFDLPSTGTVFEPRTAIVSLLVGVVVTLIAAAFPAIKATRVPPVAALSPETAFAPAGFRKRRVVIGALVTAAGVALLLAGLFRSEGNRLANVASGAVVVFLGVAILSPLIARPLARAIGWPIAKVFRVPGNLARQNAMRNPRRTASTAAALMIGLALVAFVSIFAASIKASTTRILDETIAADYIVSSQSFQP